MKNAREYLSEKETERLSLSEYVRAVRNTLEELHERKCLEANVLIVSQPKVTSDALCLTPADRRWLRNMHIKVEEA
jgi:hypothetical protein